MVGKGKNPLWIKGEALLSHWDSMTDQDEERRRRFQLYELKVNTGLNYSFSQVKRGIVSSKSPSLLLLKPLDTC